MVWNTCGWFGTYVLFGSEWCSLWMVKWSELDVVELSKIYLACFHMKFIRTTESLDPLLFQFRRIGRQQHVLGVNPCRSFLFPKQAGGIARCLARTSSFARPMYNGTFWKWRKWGHLSRHHSTFTRGAISKRKVQMGNWCVLVRLSTFVTNVL